VTHDNTAPGSFIERIAWAITNLCSETEKRLLRRLRTDKLDQPSFWRVLQWVDPTMNPSDEHLESLGFAIQAMARVAMLKGSPQSLGKALASSNFSEARLMRLVRADDEQRGSELLRAVSMLESKAQPCRLADLGRYMLIQDTEKRSSFNYTLTGDFYRSSFN